MCSLGVDQVVVELRNGYESGLLKSLEARRDVLKTIFKIINEHEDDIVEALNKDMHRPSFEAVYAEVECIKMEVELMLNNLDKWLKEEKVPKSVITVLDSVSIQKQPLGVILFLVPWNFPFALTFLPLIGAIACGNCVLIKPSEFAPVSAELIEKLISKYLDQRICQVVCGNAEVSKSLVETQRFDHILFTGGTSVGREVYKAAAQKLTPVTLELGGKCPTYVDLNVHLDMAARRIVSFKFLNAGQICVAPDYILCHRTITSLLEKKICDVIKEFYGEDPYKSPDLGRIINTQHFDRIKNLLSKTNGKIILGGETVSDDKYVAPTVITEVKEDDILMNDELFAPIIPILEVDSPDDAIRIINSKEKPLAVYVFTNNTEVFDQIKENTSSGAILQNDVTIQVAIAELPFGGVGASGIGAYRGIHSIHRFSHHRAVLLKSTVEMLNRRSRYAPYANWKLLWYRWAMRKAGSGSCILI